MSDGARRAVRLCFALLALAPFLPPLLAGVPGLGAIAAALDAWFAFQCERDPLRTWNGAAVCVRCLGVYTGFGLGGLLGRPVLSVRALALWIAGGALLIALDVVTESVSLRPPLSSLRFASGMLLSYPIGLAVAGALAAPPHAAG